MKHLLYILLTLTTGAFAQSPKLIIDIPEGQRPWNHLELNNKEENFQFAIVTDRTGGHRPGVFPTGIRKLNLLQPEFVMSVGDLIEGYTRDTSILNAEWKEFKGFIDELQAPFFYVPGNHDITNEVMEAKWKELFGKTYYHFVYHDVLFMCLNSEDSYRGGGNGMIGDEQFEYIKKTLEENDEVKWTLLFFHQPLWVQKDTKRWKEVEALLAKRKHNVFAGHYHRYWKTERENGKYIALATTGGGSRLRGPSYGEFDHVVWVTMTPEGPILANLLLEGIWDENVVTDGLVDFVRNRPFPVRLASDFSENNVFEQVTAELRLTNSSDYPMKVEINPFSHKDLLVSENYITKEVHPNSVEGVSVMVENLKKIPIKDMGPIKFNVTVTYSVPDRPELEISEVLNYLPQPKLQVIKSSGRTKVDGNLKEWEDLDYEVNKQAISNPFLIDDDSDCSFAFSARYDDSNVYLGFRVFDDDLYVSAGGRADRQDAIVISLDGRPLDKSSQNNSQGKNDDYIYIMRTLEEDNNNEMNDLPEGGMLALRKDMKGFSGELAIPLKYLKNEQKGKDLYFRLNIGLIDVDKDGEERTRLNWKPLWNSPDNLPGSGTMFLKLE